MGCNSDYMNANRLEIELSRVLLLQEELDTGKPVDSHSEDWNGYKKGVYNQGDLRARTDREVEKLCSRLKETDVSTASPEMQIWWRDHQAADKKREEAEKAEAKKKTLRENALKKLTPKERNALGLKD